MSQDDCEASLHSSQVSEELLHYATVQEEEHRPQQEMHELNPNLMSKLRGFESVNTGLLGSLVQTLHGVMDDETVPAPVEYTLAEQLAEDTGNSIPDVATVETQRDRRESENRQLRTTMRNFDNHPGATQEGLSGKVAANESEIQLKQELICSLSAEIEYMRDHIESLQGRLAENNKIREALHDLQRKEDGFRKQMKSMAGEVAHCKSLMKERDAENKSLKRAKQDLRHNLTEAKKVICEKDEVIKKQEKEITYNQKLIEELYNHTNEMKQTLCDLNLQLHMKTGDLIIPGAKNVLEECTILPESGAQPESQQERSPLEVPAGKNAQTHSWWHCYAKGALVGVGVGITIVGIFACAMSAR